MKIFALVVALSAIITFAYAGICEQAALNAFKTVSKSKQQLCFEPGASGPGRFDSAGLVFQSFKQAGFNKLGRTVSELASAGESVECGIRNWACLRMGDVAFFEDGNSKFTAIYTGNKSWTLCKKSNIDCKGDCFTRYLGQKYSNSLIEIRRFC